METQYEIIATWFSQKPRGGAWILSLFFLLGLVLLNALLWTWAPQWQDRLVATPDQVFTHHQYWRAWSSLFVHGDGGHLFGNLFLFFPLSYLLAAYFGYFLFPFWGLFWGGVINLLVLKTMPQATGLIGISGVVYWMGAVWLGLVFMIDRREKKRRRFAKVLFLVLMVFIPESYKPEISYLSHFLGFILGLATALSWFALFRRRFDAAEIRVPIEDEPAPWEQEPLA